MSDTIRESNGHIENAHSHDGEYLAQYILTSLEDDTKRRGNDRLNSDQNERLAMLAKHDAFELSTEVKGGRIDSIMRNWTENVFRQEYKDGGWPAVSKFIKYVNEWLDAQNSQFILEQGVPSGQGKDAIALTMRDMRNGEVQKFSDFNMGDKPVNPVAAGIADSVRRGTFTDADRIGIENEFKKAYKSGSFNAVNQLLDVINTELEAKGSDFRLKSGRSLIKTILAKELHLENQKSGENKKLTEFVLDDNLRSVEAGAVAERVKNGRLLKLDQVEIENAFKEAFIERGLGGAHSLLSEINNELKQLKSDYKIEVRPPYRWKRFNLYMVGKSPDIGQPISDFSLEEPYNHVGPQDLLLDYKPPRYK